MARCKKDCSLILFDLGMKSKEAGIQTLMKFASYDYFTKKSYNMTKLMFANSKGSKLLDWMQYNPAVLLKHIREAEYEAGDWLEDLLKGAKHLVEESAAIPGVITLQLIFLTDLITPLPQYEQGVADDLINTLYDSWAYLYVIGPNVELPITIKTEDDVRSAMDDLQFDKSDKNLSRIMYIIREAGNAVICSFNVGAHLLLSFKNPKPKQPWNVPLTIGRKIAFNTKTIKLLDSTNNIKISKDTSVGVTPPDWVESEDLSKKVPLSDVIKGIKRHNRFIQMPNDQMFQVQNPRSFNVVCFTAATNVPEYLLRGEGCYAVFANGGKKCEAALGLLIDCLIAQQKYIIARRIYNNNNRPKLVVLVPQAEPKCFQMCPLPFAEDVQFEYKEKSVDSAPKIETNEDIYQYLSSIDLDNPKSTKKVSLAVSMMQNVNCEKILSLGLQKYLGESIDLENVALKYVENRGKPSDSSLEKLWPQRKLDQIDVVKKEEGDNSDSDNDYEW